MREKGGGEKPSCRKDEEREYREVMGKESGEGGGKKKRA